MIIRLIAALFVVAFLSACQTQGHYIDQEEAAEIRESVKSAEDLYTALGTPSVTIPKGQGKVLWVYEGVHTTPGVTQFIPYLNYAIGTNDQKCTTLSVVIDEATGLVEDWAYHAKEDTDHWTNRDETCTDAKSAKENENAD